MNLVVGVSDVKVSTASNDIIVTYALGSCVGLSVFDPVVQVGALIHCMLPLSKTDRTRAEERPAMFVDSGVTELLKKLFDLKATKENMTVCVAGGASPLDIEGGIKIGDRNVAVLRKLLWRNDLLIAAEEVGGTVARTMTLDMSTGVTKLRSLGTEREMNPVKPTFALKIGV